MCEFVGRRGVWEDERERDVDENTRIRVCEGWGVICGGWVFAVAVLYSHSILIEKYSSINPIYHFIYISVLRGVGVFFK